MRIEGRAPHALHTQRSVWVALRRSSRYRDPTRFGGRLVHPHLPEGLAGTNARHQDEERREGDRLASFGGEPPTGVHWRTEVRFAILHANRAAASPVEYPAARAAPDLRRVGAAEARRSCVPAFSQHVLAQLHFYPARSLSVLDGAREWEAGAYGRDDVRPLRQGRTRTGVAQGMGRKSGLGLQASARVQASPEPKVGSTSATKLSFWTEWTENRNFGTARNGCKPMIGWRLLDYSPVPKRQKSVG